MKKIKTYNLAITILLISSLFWSCSEGSFTRVVDLDIEESGSELAVLARMNTADDKNLILVSETISVLDTGEFRSLSDAQVTLKTPDQGDLQIGFDPQYNLYSIGDYEFQEGENYTLEVDHPDHAPMKADIKVPRGAEIIDVKVSDAGGNSPATLFNIKFKDPAGEDNVYLFRARIIREIVQSKDTAIFDIRFDLSNNILEYNDNYISDLTFDGKEHELILIGYSNSSTSQETKILGIELDIISLSEDFILYDRSVEQAYDAEDNPFVEPSTIYSNFDSGFGIFVVDVVKTFKIEF